MMHASPATVTTPPEQSFYDFMASKGLAPPDLPIADGERHRYHVERDKPGTKNGWYVFFTDGVPAGSFGTWKDGPPWHKWCTKEHLRDTEREEYRQRMDGIEAARAKEQAERYAEARDKAQSIWRKASPDPQHSYLQDKGIRAYRIREHQGCLIVPAHDTDGVIHSVQFISAQGEKRFLPGGAITRHYCSIGTPEQRMYLCEGYATGASIHEATQCGVVVAFNAGNLLPVAEAIHAKYPHHRLVIAGDNDQWTEGNPGRTKAIKAAQAVNAELVIPSFKDTKPKPTDFNDLHGLEGLDVVREQLMTSTEPPKANEQVPRTKDSFTLADDAFYGLPGEVVRLIEPQTESDPAAILVQFLVACGSTIGPNPHFRVEADKHRANDFVILVGETSKSRKGSSWGHVRRIHEMVEDPWEKECIVTGLSSGEGLIWQVRDAIIKREKRGKGSEATYEDVEIDGGVTDKRLLVIESEFASTLRRMGQEGNTLSSVIRQAWDRGDLGTMTKHTPAKATGTHISIIGHITSDELRRYLDRTEIGNGFANRFLYMCVRRSKYLPEGGSLTDDDLRPYAKRLAEALGFARSVGVVKRDKEARQIWEKVYRDLSDGKGGLFGAVTSRAEAHVMRIAMIYALLDRSDLIKAPHLKAALALWEYAEESARAIFGSALGDPLADEIHRALKTTPGGLTLTDISNLFGRNRKAQSIHRALDLLRREKLAVCERLETEKGRPSELWVAV